jgi:regulator of sigma E protease
LSLFDIISHNIIALGFFMGILVALLVLSALIFFHELGHFLAARFFGVHVEVFSIGFGKRLWHRQIGDTQWQLSAIPLGGYVKMKGQDDTNPLLHTQESDSYNSKKPWQRIIILLAGPFANFLMAFLLYLAIAYMGVPKLLSYVGSVQKESPALMAGLQKSDHIVAINGHPVRYWEEISPYINHSQGALSVEIEREGAYKRLLLEPKMISDTNLFGEEIQRKVIGISPLLKQTTVVYGFVEGFGYAWEETKKSSLLIFQSIQKLLSGVVSADKVGGVITIVDVTSKASSAGILSLLFFTALISVNLGVLNLMPIPALDGGHIMFNLYEMVRGKAPNEQAIYYLTLMGWALLLSLMLLGVYNDITRLWGN